jgi:hypothetical protein
MTDGSAVLVTGFGQHVVENTDVSQPENGDGANASAERGKGMIDSIWPFLYDKKLQDGNSLNL